MLKKMMLLFGICIALLALSVTGSAQDFSVDPLSPEVTELFPFSPADIVGSLGAPVVKPAAALGLAAGDNVDGFSYGLDEILPPDSPRNILFIWFSVTRATVGLGPILAESGTDGAAGDKFRYSSVGGGLLFTLMPSYMV